MRELLDLVLTQPADYSRQGLHAPFASFLHDANSLRSRLNHHRTPILFVGLCAHQLGPQKAGNDSAHRRWFNLLGIGEFGQGFRPREHQDREGGQLGGPYTSLAIPDTQSSQQMNGGGMQAIGGLQCPGFWPGPCAKVLHLIS